MLYNHFSRELKEVDPVLLNHQTSISETRKPSESAIYRSVDVPHGVTVTRGLGLRNGYKIRDGCLKDIWYLALNDKDNDSKQTEICFGNAKFTLGQINTILHIISKIPAFSEKLEQVVIFGDLIESPQLVLAILSCFFVTDTTVVLCKSLDDLAVLQNSFAGVIFTDSEHAEQVPREIFKEVIGIDITGESANVLSNNKFTHVISIPQEIDSMLDYDYNPDSDFAKVNNHPYSVISQGNETRFFQVNFVSAIASKVMSVPSALSWNEKDTLLLSYTDQSSSSTNVIFGICCGLISNVQKIQLISPTRINTLKELTAFKPTLLCIDSHLLKKLCSSTTKTFWQSFKLQRSEYLNSLGYFNTFGKVENSLNLKMVYVCQLSPVLSSFICNFCKSVLGCRIVREVYTAFSLGPILKTNIYDFRIVQNRSLALLGVPANSVELKTVNPAEGETRGKLYVRGMSIGKGDHVVSDEEYWVDTGIEGIFARDGCFYGKF